VPASLFQPLALGGLVLDNRIVVSPMAQYSAVAGLPQNWHVQHWGSLLVGGPGLVIIEATSVDAFAPGSSASLALFTDEHEAGLKRVVDQVRSISSTPLGIQLGHNGRKASTALPHQGGRPLTPAEGGWPICAPSAIAFGDTWPMPQELDREGIERVRNAFVASAIRAARIGFDAVEIHGAHGYLLHSFLSPLSNLREDAYGGSLANRVRLPCEIVSGIRAVWPSSRPVGIRLNSCDWAEGGLAIGDTIAIVAALKEAGCDYVAVSSGALVPESRIPAAPGYLAPYSEAIRRATGITTMVTGMIADPGLAEEIVASGKADAVAIARAFLDDPRWVWRAAQRLGADLAYPMPYERAHPSKWLRPEGRRAG
jgi:2,4-dienoyl-CoA reductase-like NADH-dependent reductase (Old Yellow Enzyme family)